MIDEHIPDDDLAPDKFGQEHLDVEAEGDEHGEALEVGRVLHRLDVVDGEADQQVHHDDGHDHHEDEEERQREGLVRHCMGRNSWE